MCRQWGHSPHKYSIETATIISQFSNSQHIVNHQNMNRTLALVRLQGPSYKSVLRSATTQNGNVPESTENQQAPVCMDDRSRATDRPRTAKPAAAGGLQILKTWKWQKFLPYRRNDYVKMDQYQIMIVNIVLNVQRLEIKVIRKIYIQIFELQRKKRIPKSISLL